MASSNPAFPPESTIIQTLRAAGCVFAEEEAQLLMSSAKTPADLADLVARRVSGLPLEYILGFAEFCGLRIEVDSGVFVPRRRTEFLTERAIELARSTVETKAYAGRRTVVVDLCCGAGAIAATMAAALDGIALYASDVDGAAVQCARRNIGRRGEVYEGDLFEPLPRALHNQIDILTANAPYVPTRDIELMPQEARCHEHRAALDGGEDGLAIQRRIAAEANQWLAPGGYLLMETSERQAPQTLQILTSCGLAAHLIHSDELDATVAIGKRADTL